MGEEPKQKIPSDQMRAMSDADLMEMLQEQRTEIANLRFPYSQGLPPMNSRKNKIHTLMKNHRRNVARILTILGERRRANV